MFANSDVFGAEVCPEMGTERADGRGGNGSLWWRLHGTNFFIKSYRPVSGLGLVRKSPRIAAILQLADDMLGDSVTLILVQSFFEPTDDLSSTRKAKASQKT